MQCALCDAHVVYVTKWCYILSITCPVHSEKCDSIGRTSGTQPSEACHDFFPSFMLHNTPPKSTRLSNKGPCSLHNQQHQETLNSKFGLCRKACSHQTKTNAVPKASSPIKYIFPCNHIFLLSFSKDSQEKG